MNNKKQVFSWALFDFANSTFSTTIMAGFFPIFFKQYWSLGADPLLTTARLGTLISISSLAMAIMSPIIGTIADQKQSKKIGQFFFMLLGVFASLWMSQIPQGAWDQAAFAYGLGLIGFFGSIIFNDSLLPFVAPGKSSDWVSGLGYSMGYLGGGILFGINVLMYLKPELFGIADGVTAIKLSYLTVGIWWFIFTLPVMIFIPEPKNNSPVKPILTVLKQTHKSLAESIREIFKNPNLKFFVLAYWVYIDGVYTIMNMAVDLGINLGFAASDLISALLLVQFIGFPATLVLSKVAEKKGCKPVILSCLVVYCLTVVLATQMDSSWHFYALAAVIGLVQGGVQASSRSLFSRMVPSHKSAEYFGFFNLLGKFASILGPLIVGWITYLAGSSKVGLSGLLVLLVAGIILLLKVEEPKSA